MITNIERIIELQEEIEEEFRKVRMPNYSAYLILAREHQAKAKLYASKLYEYLCKNVK